MWALVGISHLMHSMQAELTGDGRMFKKVILVAAFIAAAAVPAYAKNFALPEKNPVATVVIPDSWDVDESEFGYSATSPDDDVIFTIESATAARVDKLIESNMKWMKDQDIVPKGPATQEKIVLNGVPAEVYSYKATDPDGDTIIDFVLLPASNGRVLLLTLWGPDEAREENKADISTILNSVKPIN